MFVFDSIPIPRLGLAGLEAELSEQERAIQEVTHRFAEQVMRPLGQVIDKMTPDEAVAEGSPIWDYLRQMKASGILDLASMASMDAAQKGRIIPLIFEELGWGDPGLGLLSLVTAFPAFAAYTTGKPELINRFGPLRGCWLATQPDRGSDLVDLDATEIHPGTRHDRGNLLARMEGDTLLIDGQSSAWVSGAPIAECALVYCQCDYGDGLWNERGGLNYVTALVPLDLKGISKGKPLDKLGQRPLPQGEIFFDDVLVPREYVIATREAADVSFFGALTFGNMEMAVTFTGVARAAFEHALAYVHQRRQGGTELIRHQSIRQRLFDMWRKVETSRAIARRVVQYNYGPNGPHLLASITSKTYVTQAAFEVANEALQLFGGSGLTKEYPMEKLLRDARAALIEDGENTILSLKGCTWLSSWYQAQTASQS